MEARRAVAARLLRLPVPRLSVGFLPGVGGGRVLCWLAVLDPSPLRMLMFAWAPDMLGLLLQPHLDYPSKRGLVLSGPPGRSAPQSPSHTDGGIVANAIASTHRRVTVPSPSRSGMGTCAGGSPGGGMRATGSLFGFPPRAVQRSACHSRAGDPGGAPSLSARHTTRGSLQSGLPLLPPPTSLCADQPARGFRAAAAATPWDSPATWWPSWTPSGRASHPVGPRGAACRPACGSGPPRRVARLLLIGSPGRWVTTRRIGAADGGARPAEPVPVQFARELQGAPPMSPAEPSSMVSWREPQAAGSSLASALDGLFRSKRRPGRTPSDAPSGGVTVVAGEE